MPRGVSLHVGVNETDPDCFEVVRLDGCVNDATAMYYLAKLRGFSERRLLLDGDATYHNVVTAIEDAAGHLKDEGDVFLFTFSGHGTQVSDEDGELFEFQDEAMVLHDRILLDDVLRRRCWPKFNPGVRVILVTDCCHGGTLLAEALIPTEVSVSQSLSLGGDVMTMTTEVTVSAAGNGGALTFGSPRTLPEGARLGHLEKFPNFYRRELSTLPPARDLQSSLIHLAACVDERTTPDGLPHGLFTQALLDVWDGGNFPGTYEEFRQALEAHQKLADRNQVPVIEPELGAPLTPAFRDQKPIFAF